MPTVKIGDIEMFYAIHGEGEPLVLIQGLTMDSTGWAMQIAELSQKYKVIVFDNRGVGQTSTPQMPYTIKMMADDTAGLMEALDIDKAHVLGLSLGGMIAQELAINYPDKISSLMLAATSACHAGSKRASNIVGTLLKMAMAGVSLELRARMFMAWSFTEKFYRDPDNVKMTISMILANPHPQTVHGLAGQVAATTTHDTRGRLDRIKAPTLVFVGGEDLLLPVSESEVLASSIPGAELVVVEGAGHFFCFELPQKFNRAVLDFLDRTYHRST